MAPRLTSLARRLNRGVQAMLLLVGLTIPLGAFAEGPPLNLLVNAGFEPQSGSSSFSGQGAGPSAAADWETFNITRGTTTTEVLPVPGGKFILHVTTDGWGDGVANVFLPFGTGPMQSVAFARVLVVRGQVGLGTGNGGQTGFDAISRTIGAWETVAGIHGGSHANEFIVYATSEDGAEFYVDSPSVLAVESNGAAPGAISSLRSGRACNGVFGGTFNGDVTVSTGQSCVFIDGTITGTVHQHGGNLVLAGGLIGTNVQINGGAFSIGPLTTINGNLQAQGLPGSAFSQVCDSIVHGDLRVNDNVTPVQIGSISPSSCAGNVVRGHLQVNNNHGWSSIVANTVGGNLQHNDNTGASQVIGNAVKKTLQCQNNRAIKHGLNTAQRIQGQCVEP